MLFQRLDFFLFMAVVFAVYLRLGHRGQNLWLLASSYFFYSMWDWRFSGLILLTTLVDFMTGWAMAAGWGPRRRWLILSIVSNLGVLGVFKYSNFFLDTLGRLLSDLGIAATLPALRVALPIGISFYTFQSLSYAIDVYRGDVEAHRPARLGPGFGAAAREVLTAFADLALYVSFFPHLVAGPIQRTRRLLAQVLTPRRVTAPGIAEGLWLFAIGLAMKVGIADPVSHQVDQVYASLSAYSPLSIYAATLGFALQIFCDFGGYSMMARGLAALMGFDLMVNFMQPYLAASFADFWRRWHISLSQWVRDYLYIPLGGNRGSGPRVAFNLMLTMMLSGLWHGATWAFVAWGGLHGAFLVVERALGLGEPQAWRSALARLAYGAVVFQGVLLGWFLFRLGDLSAVALHASRLLAGASAGLATFLPLGLPETLPYLNFAVLMLLYEIPCWRHNRVLLARDLGPFHRLLAYLALASIILSAGGERDSPFIYFQF
jgi:alginate O-acetyltransferase complex protein AlgI